MSQSPDSSSLSAALSPAGGAEAIRDGLRGKYVCPFCGSVNDSEQGMCPRCTMENSAATRKATKTRIGPWYVLQTRNPAAPGMTWETLLSFIRKGRVKPRSIVRGPTTHQLWRFAAQVKGLSREFGICYSCGSGIETNASLCQTCNRLQEPPPNPDALLEASRDAQLPSYGTPPATIDGNVLAASGPATLVGQVAGGIAASAPAVVAPPVNEGDFVIPALGAMPAAASGAGVAAGAKVAAAALTPGPATPIPVAPSTGVGPGRRGAQVAAPGAVQVDPAAGGVSGIAGDTSWAKIPESPKDRAAGRPRQRGQNNGPAFNPYADDDAPGRTNNADGGFLSAKDLAAAFNLGFVGEEEESPVQRTVRQPAAQAQARSAAGALPPGYPAPAPRGRGLKVVLLLLLLGLAGFGVAIAVVPGLFDSVKTWVKTQVDNLSKQTENDKLGDQPRGGAPAKPKPPATRPADVPTPPPTTGNDEPTGVVPATNPSSPTTPGLGITSAQKAFGDALELEETDPAKALERYKRIKLDFPRDEWPTVLESAIRRVEAKLGNRPPG